MRYLVESHRIYDPETITVMTAAFDEACRSLSAALNSDDAVRRRLAEAILRCVDQGERDPAIMAAWP